MTYCHNIIASPIGDLTLVATDAALIAIRFPGEDDTRARVTTLALTPDHPVLRAAETQLSEYFGGVRRMFDLPLAPQGTPFRVTVWEALLAVPFGETCSYATIARRIGQPTATRAVGAANGRNPIPIVIPCHRVIGADGSLTGFGGGLPTKRFLLDHERHDLFSDGK